MDKKTNLWMKTGVFLVLCFLFFPEYAFGAEGSMTGGTEIAEEEPKEKSAGLSDEDADKFFDFVREKWDSGAFSDKEAILEAIEEGEKNFGVSLGDSQREQIADGIEKLDGLGLNHDTVIDFTKKIYKEYGDDLTEDFQDLYKQYGTVLTEGMEKAIEEQVVEPVKQAAFSAIKNAVTQFFRDLKESVVSFFRNIFSR